MAKWVSGVSGAGVRADQHPPKPNGDIDRVVEFATPTSTPPRNAVVSFEVTTTSQVTAQRVSALNDRLRQDISRDERARLSLQLYQQNAAMGQIVSGRCADTQYVLDCIDAILRQIPGWQDVNRRPHTRVAVLGLSLGGAVATELSKADVRCVAAVNMDGGQPPSALGRAP